MGKTKYWWGWPVIAFLFMIGVMIFISLCGAVIWCYANYTEWTFGCMSAIMIGIGIYDYIQQQKYRKEIEKIHDLLQSKDR